MAENPHPKVVPILESELMVFDPVQSGWTQKQRDYAQMLIDKYQPPPQDVPDAVQYREKRDERRAGTAVVVQQNDRCGDDEHEAVPGDQI